MDRLEKLEKTYFLTTASISKVSLPDIHIEEILAVGKAKVSTPEITLENQRDLMKIISVLVSTGINRNDDVFLPEEILPVRNTGAHKPLNIEHDPKQIVGHMIRTYAALKDGTIVGNKETPEDSEFDVIAESVLYKFLFPDLAEEVKSLAKANKLFVSIEAWFTAYDFLVGSKIVKRTQETSNLLDGHLKMNGGSGKYENQRLGRVLRNLIIGGIGLVKVPANMESVIKSVSSIQSEFVQNDIENEVINQNTIGDIFELSTNNLKDAEDKMNNEVIEEIAQVIAAQRAASTTSADVKVENAETNANPEVKILLERVSALELSNKELKTKMEASELKAESDARAKILQDLGLSEALIVTMLSKSFFVARNDFDELVALLRAFKVECESKLIQNNKEKAIEGGDKAKAKVEVNSTQVVDNKEVKAVTETAAPAQPKAEVKPETKPEAKVEVKPEAPKAELEVKTAEVEKKTETKDSSPAAPENDANQETDSENDSEDVISLEDLELVDKEVKVETTQKAAPSLTEQMADVVQLFLKERNDKWGKLALNK